MAAVVQALLLKLVQEGGTHYDNAACADEGWSTLRYSFVMQFVQVRGGKPYDIHL